MVASRSPRRSCRRVAATRPHLEGGGGVERPLFNAGQCSPMAAGPVIAHEQPGPLPDLLLDTGLGAPSATPPAATATALPPGRELLGGHALGIRNLRSA